MSKNWDECLRTILFLNILPSMNEYRQELEENPEYDPNWSNVKLFEQVGKEWLTDFSEPKHYTGFMKSDVTFEKKIGFFKIQMIGEYMRSHSPITIKAIIESKDWPENYNDDLSDIIMQDDTSMDNFLNLLNTAICDVSAKALSENLENYFTWEYIRPGLPFEGNLKLTYDLFGDMETEELVDIPVKVEIKKGPYFRAEFLVKDWR
ncbi:hypothetical protein COV11_00195 [Candidatus Woesearchaeota archaeon CG10_big_fil_rev_8_21_14_0_10_30_7]|nr:MAG: hypothetical protein COV11_00195 [Candidatus Woesearchaeota archaeon CG10_big_fil_rev_8_21_14_0_10_30_7]